MKRPNRGTSKTPKQKEDNLRRYQKKVGQGEFAPKKK